MRDRIWLGFSVGNELDFFLSGGQNRLRFLYAGRKLLRFNLWIVIYLVFSVGIEIDLVFECRTKMTCSKKGIYWLKFCADGWNWHGFCMLAKYYLVLVWPSNFTYLLCGWLKLAWLHWGGSTSTWYPCSDRNWLSFGAGVENDLVLVFRCKLTPFWYGDQNCFDFCVGSKMTWF